MRIRPAVGLKRALEGPGPQKRRARMRRMRRGQVVRWLVLLPGCSSMSPSRRRSRRSARTRARSRAHTQRALPGLPKPNYRAVSAWVRSQPVFTKHTTTCPPSCRGPRSGRRPRKECGGGPQGLRITPGKNLSTNDLTPSHDSLMHALLPSISLLGVVLSAHQGGVSQLASATFAVRVDVVDSEVIPRQCRVAFGV